MNIRGVRRKLCRLIVPVLIGMMTIGVSSCEEVDGKLVPGTYRPYAVKGVRCEVSSEEEWVTDEESPFVFSYNITPSGSSSGKLTFEIIARVPSGGPEEWHYSLEIPNPVPGESISGKAVSNFVPEPGFYQITATLNGETIRYFNVACGLGQYRVEDDRPEDFEDFWERALDDLEKVEMDPVMELDERLSTETYSLYNVSYQSAGDFTGETVTIRGYYWEPKTKTNFPVQISFCGYEEPSSINKPLAVPAPPGDGKGSLVIYTRGQGLNNREGRGTPYGKPIVSRLDDPDEYYYKGAYLDAARAVDFVLSREGVDTDRIYTVGGSQGGVLALAAAALRPGALRFTCAAFPFMGHFPLYLQTARWPADDIAAACRIMGLEHYEALRTLSYFDTKNLACMVRTPVAIQITLQDTTCPPWTQYPIICNLPEGNRGEWMVAPASDHTGGRPVDDAQNRYIKKMLAL